MSPSTVPVYYRVIYIRHTLPAPGAPQTQGSVDQQGEEPVWPQHISANYVSFTHISNDDHLAWFFLTNDIAPPYTCRAIIKHIARLENMAVDFDRMRMFSEPTEKQPMGLNHIIDLNRGTAPDGDPSRALRLVVTQSRNEDWPEYRRPAHVYDDY
ncbi:hypothetical protein DL93DRAFT_2163470 [Clavulina sp. PMI_390]|nr:hypothetical protein DL93DRAFT_2163470 [Clavulina sp. PMI_390]